MQVPIYCTPFVTSIIYVHKNCPSSKASWVYSNVNVLKTEFLNLLHFES